MKFEMHFQRWLILLCTGLCGASFTMEAAESAQLADLRGVFQASFNQDASRLITWTRSGETGIWDTKKGTPITGDPSLQKLCNAYVMSPDGRRVLAGFKDGGSRILDASSGSAVSPLLEPSLREDGNPQAVFSPDGGAIIFFGEKKASVLDVKTGKLIATIPIPFELEERSDSTALAIFASGGTKCFVMEPHGTVTAYETKGWTKLGTSMIHPAAERAYQFGFEASSDGKWIVTFDDPGENGPKGQLQVWNALTNKPLGGPLSAVNGMSGRFLLGKDRVLVQSGRGEASVRDLPSMKTSYVIKQHDELDGPRIEVSPNGKWLFAWGPDKKLDLIDAATGKTSISYTSAIPITGVMIPPDSTSCYTSFDNSPSPADGHFGNSLQRFSVPDMKAGDSANIPDFLLRQSLSADGRWIMVVLGMSDKESIAIFDTATMKPVEWSKP